MAAASNRSTTNCSPSTGGSVKALNMLERDMVDRLSSDKTSSVLQHQILQESNSSSLSFLPPFTGTCSSGFHTDSFHLGAESPRSYHSHTDILSSQKVSPGMRYDAMFYHGNGVPSDLQRPSNSTRNQSLPQQHYGHHLYADDDSRQFLPFHSPNQQQYPVPEPVHLSPEFLMFQANSTHVDRHASERNSFETDYMMMGYTTGNFGLRNNIFSGEEPRGLKLNPFTARRSMKQHPAGFVDLSANAFDMGSPRRFLHDGFESAASLSYREQQLYNQCKRGSSSSPRPTWELDYNLSPLDESRSGRCSDFYHRPVMSDLLTERNRGPRASRLNDSKSKMITYDDRFCQQDVLSKFRDAKFFVIKSYSEDNVYKSIKYCVWASTKNGNKKLDAAYREAKTKQVASPVFLLFSVNASAQFCGVAEMVGPVDFETSVEYWQQDRWSGHFPVKWLVVKDVPNSLFRHIIIEDNDNKPVTNSRDTQEVGLEQGIEMLNIFSSCEMKSSMLDDFSFYEERQRATQDRKARQRALLQNLTASSSLTSVPTHHASSLHDDYVREMSKSFAEALALQHKLN